MSSLPTGTVTFLFDRRRRLWGRQYQRRLSDLPLIRKEVTKDVLDSLRVRLSREEKRRMSRFATRSAPAYQAYLKGRYHWHKFIEDGLKQSVEAGHRQ